MALNTNPFVEGIDPSGTFGGYASVLLQLIRQAQPSSTYGMILFDTATPDVTGANAWRKRCIWVNLTTPGTPTVNVYKEGGSPGWSNVQALIPPLTIKNSMISNPDPLDADKGISITKLSPIGGAANQLIRINGTATGFQFVSLASLVTAGSIPVGSLITTGIPAGQLRFAGTIGPGTATWYDAQQIINALADASIGSDLIAPAPITSTRSKQLTTRTADTFATWRYFEPNVDILNDTMNGSKLQAGTVGPERIYSTGVPDGYLLSKVAGVPDWVAPPVIPVAPMTREFAYIAGPSASLLNSSETQIYVGTTLDQPTTNAQWNSASGEYTALNTGYFKFTVCAYATGNLVIRLKKNGTIVSHTYQNTGDSLVVLTHIEKVVTANTDVFAIFAYVPGLSNLALRDHSSFTIERIDTV